MIRLKKYVIMKVKLIFRDLLETGANKQEFVSLLVKTEENLWKSLNLI